MASAEDIAPRPGARRPAPGKCPAGRAVGRPYFHAYDNVTPPEDVAMTTRRELLWHFLAALALGLGAWYLHWRWTGSLNPDAPWFSITVAGAETLVFAGTILFFFDIWREGELRRPPPPLSRRDIGLDGGGPVRIDIFVATLDEPADIVQPTLAAARAVRVPPGCEAGVFLLDDGGRLEMARLARAEGARYLAREGNRGYKAGNLGHALLASEGDIIVICDADTRLFPSFLENTLGYFRDPFVAWVQTPHWFPDIPQGQSVADFLRRRCGPLGRWLAHRGRRLLCRARLGVDPFASDPGMFFDVIQRRRGRNGATFCCGAGSLHRREALFAAALAGQGARLRRLSLRLGRRGAAGQRVRDRTALLLSACAAEPFRHHVSEDLLTSIDLHGGAGGKWRAVYHPRVESRMLSPWSVDAWHKQRRKYAAGTFDILLRHRPLMRRGMPMATRLHYLATFWSYLSALWLPVFLFAPVVSLATGIAPVAAYSAEFFGHLLPYFLVHEAALIVGCKGHNVLQGRLMALATLPLTLSAFVSVLRGRRPGFSPTPKLPALAPSLGPVRANALIAAVMVAAGLVGIGRAAAGAPGYSASFLAVNLFWLGFNLVGIARPVAAAFWRPEDELAAREAERRSRPAPGAAGGREGGHAHPGNPACKEMPT